MQAILVTDAAHYAGPGAVRALLAQGAHLVCHGVPAPDRAAIAREYPAVVFLESLDADGVADELAAPEEIGDLIAFLVSGKARFVTGQAVGFSGGGWP